VVRSQEGGEDWIRFVVADNGIGMTKEQMGRLFEAFSQADASTTRKFGGTGLGLAISKKFCELMGGGISVKSELGEGTTFTIRIPSEAAAATSRGPSDTVNAAKSSQAMTPPDRDTVLVIDDDPAVRDLMERWLTKDGFHTEVAASGQQGLQLARGLRPAVITLDVLMPQMDGWAVLTELKSDPNTAGIPVLMLTIADDAKIGFALGAVDYLTKPIEREQITKVLRRLARDGREGTVLIIDDDADSRSLARSFLERRGWEVREAVDGREGLRRLAEARPDLVLLDLIMPGMDGFDFMEEVRKHPEWSKLPVVVLTAKNLTAEERQRLNGCVHRVMRKGAGSREGLLQAIHNAIATHEVAAAGMEGV
jgi:CheY-like chemotaxis protein